jgi:hypothetical protein
MNVGVKLREQAAERRLRKDAINYLASISVQRQNEERAQIRGWFETAKADALEAVTKGIEPTGIKVKGYGMPFIFPVTEGVALNVYATSPQHPYHDVFVPFAEWASKNDVQFYINDGYDGVDWEYRITVISVPQEG